MRRPAGPPTQDLLDAWLLGQFPGRTLDELDQMDWPRYLRALDVMRIREIELDRLEFIRGVTSIEDMDPQIWRAIQLHDRLCDDDDDK